MQAGKVPSVRFKHGENMVEMCRDWFHSAGAVVPVWLYKYGTGDCNKLKGDIYFRISERLHMQADTEYTINFTQRQGLQSQVKSPLNTRYHWSRMSAVQPANRTPQTKVIIHPRGQQFSPHGSSWQGQEFLQHVQPFLPQGQFLTNTV